MAEETGGLVGRFAAHQLFKNEMMKRIGDTIVVEQMVERKPITRWQRIKWRLEDWRDRLRNAWLALRGEWPEYD